jgi:AraC-like DNA-binding protein
VQIIYLDHFVKEFHYYLDFYAFVHILRSSSRVRYACRDYEAASSQVFLGEPGVYLSTDPREMPESIHGMHIEPRQFEALARECGHARGAVHFNVVAALRPEYRRPLRRLFQALRSNASALEIQSRYLTSLRSILDRAAVEPPVDPPPGREDDAVRRACRALAERLAENVTLDELAAQAGLPRLRFFRAFRRRMGLPPHEYQLQRRISAARVRLARQEPVIDVAFDLGFADQAHFTRHFTRIVGCPPKAFARAFAPTWNVPI